MTNPPHGDLDAIVGGLRMSTGTPVPTIAALIAALADLAAERQLTGAEVERLRAAAVATGYVEAKLHKTVPTAPVVPTGADVHDRIAEALACADGWEFAPGAALRDMGPSMRERYDRLAAAVVGLRRMAVEEQPAEAPAYARAAWETYRRDAGCACTSPDPSTCAVSHRSGPWLCVCHRLSAELTEEERATLFPKEQPAEAWDVPDARPGTTDHTLLQRRQPAEAPESGGIAQAVAALQAKAQELSTAAEEEMRRDLEEQAQVWHQAAELVRRVGRKAAGS